MRQREGWHGWDDYAPFYDWENARTLGRRDLGFWRRMVAAARGPVLELGCGTGRLSVPLARQVTSLVGIDRSAAMLERLRRRLRRARAADRVSLVRADIRSLPFSTRRPFDLVMAPYGVLQSLLKDRDLAATLRSVFDVLGPGGRLIVDLVPDLPRWREYERRVSLTGRSRRGHLTLVESVRQDPARRLTIFDQEFVERVGGRRRVHRFSLTFRTLSVPQIVGRLRRTGFRVDAVVGDYRGRPWDERAEVWIVIASRPR